MNNTSWYLYGIVSGNGPRTLGRIGIGSPPEEVIRYRVGDVAALVSHVPTSVSEASTDDVMAHARVLDTALGGGTVLPVAFGTIARDEQRLGEILREHLALLRGWLDEMEGRIEVGVKVLWRKENIAETVRKRLGLRHQATTTDRETAIRIGQEVEAVVNGMKDGEIAQVYTDLSRMALDARQNRPISLYMLLNASFLLPREAEPAFHRKVLALDQARHDTLVFRYSAPLPPYNFVHLQLTSGEGG